VPWFWRYEIRGIEKNDGYLTTKSTKVMKKRNFGVVIRGWGKDANFRNMLHREKPKRKGRAQ
jgi:hypothetical protein